MEEYTDYPLAGSQATKMLAAAAHEYLAKTGKSQRQLAHEVGYKTSVVLSHILLGRVPIPVDRALDFAKLLAIDERHFLLAVLKQRHPDINFDRVLSGVNVHELPALAKLEAAAGMAIDDIAASKLEVLCEVAASDDPLSRWMSNAELAKFNSLKQLKG